MSCKSRTASACSGTPSSAGTGSERRFGGGRLPVLCVAVRVNWLNAYYWQQAINIYKKEKQVFQHLLAVHENLLGSNKVQQKDVVRAQFELSQLNQKIIFAKQQRDETNSKLTRWLPYQFNQLRFQLPHWSAPLPIKTMEKIIQQHPIILIDRKKSEVSKQGIKLAEQQYIPGVNVGVVYGVRQGDNSMKQKRSNFIGAQVSMNLPIFVKNRQGRRLKASEDRYVAAQMQQMSDYRQLKSQLLENYASWQRLLQQDKLYKTHLIHEAEFYAESTRVAYQNKRTDFPTLARAYISAYKTKLAALKIKIGVLQARTNLLYLQGI